MLLALAAALAGCGEEAGRPDRPYAEILDTYDEGADADRMVLDQLAAAGSDLTMPTDVRWYVHLPSSRAAEAFAARAREAGWSVERLPAAGETAAVCVCYRDAVPALEGIRAMRAALIELGKGLEPDVDGWEAAVQK